MRLRPFLASEAGESPASFVSRLAAFHGKPLRVFCSDLALDLRGVLAGTKPSLERLADLADLPVATLAREAWSKDGERFRIHGETLTLGGVVRSTVRVCPSCIAHDRLRVGPEMPSEAAAYGRSIWPVAYLRTCVVHGEAMVDLPATSGTTVDDFAQVVRAFDPGSVERVARDPSGFESYIFGRLEGRSGPAWLDGLPFYAAAKVCETLGAVDLFGRGVRPARLSEAQLRSSGERGFDIASLGADAIHESLRRLWRTFPKGRDKPNGPNAWFGVLYEWLEHHTEDPAYDPLRELLVETVCELAPFHPNERMFGRAMPFRGVHSPRSAFLEYGVPGRRIRQICASAGLLAPGHETLEDHEITFDAPSAADLLRVAAAAVTLDEVATILDVNWTTANSLVRTGHVAPLEFEATASAHALFDRDMVEAFLDSLATGAQVVEQAPKGSYDLCAIHSRCHCSVADVIDMILEGRLKCRGRFAGARGFGSILVDQNEVRALHRRPDLDGYTRRDIECRFGLPTRTVNALLDRGHLKSTVQRHPDLWAKVVVIAHEDWAGFQTRYVKLGDVARRMGTNYWSVEPRLSAEGIYPVLTKDEFGSVFYDRERIERYFEEVGGRTQPARPRPKAKDPISTVEPAR